MPGNSFRKLLERCLDEQLKSGTTHLLGARLGVLLRKQAPDFDPQEWGAPSLVELLESVPDIGLVERRDGSDFVFLLSDSSSGSPRVPEPTSSDPNQQRRMLRAPLWHVLVSPTAEKDAWVDLATSTLRFSPDEEVAQHPVRFLRVPPLEQARAREWANAFVGEHELWGNELVEESLDASDERWFPEFCMALEREAA